MIQRLKFVSTHQNQLELQFLGFGRSRRKEKMSDYISEEVLIEILKRLPVKSLVRFRCVSKFWYSLITSPNFISLHIAHSIETNKTYPLLKLRSLTDYNDKLILCNDDDSFTPILQLGLPIKNPEKRTGSTQFKIVGSCNGLICLCDLWFKGLHLWNPALGEFVTIFTPTRTSGCITVTGFGFDSKKNDYKVVKVEYQPEIILPLIQIYELSSNSWRTISVTNLTCVVSHLGSPTYVNGVVHWFGRKMGVTGKTLRITSFDFGDEAFGELMLPDVLSYWPPSRFHLALSVCGQLLTLIQYGAHSFDLDSLCRGFNMSCCIWMMKEYGVTQSWTKQYTVNLENHGGFLSILSFRGNGEFLLEKRRDELALYDPKTKRMTSLGARGLSKYYKVYSYMLSLVSLKGLNEMLVEGDDVEKTKKLKTSIEE